MIIYGASGHAKVIIDVLKSIGKEIDHILDDDRSLKKILGFDVKHDISQDIEKLDAIIAIGNNSIRKNVSKKLSNNFCEAIIDKSAVVSKDTEIQYGTVVMPNAIVNSSTSIGAHCIINTNSVVEHDVIIGDFVHISPSATVTGNVKIGEGSHIGAGAVIIPGVKIGEWVTIGAGSVIINDIPDHAVVVGNPGKIIKYNKIDNG
ncbi:acetyltransferase [Christiangramia sp. SM2212]|uniref:Acetyltransferase n=1 Tax=Christiangramia sediminicola TaxID=3073267 RepID=A0ABU1EQT3_9FLAO|nr:acetyltransferase [Christiangramia sp. SM2212]MDR5590563.1 acetyltransferase [Christiangramia sp. SM2212]